MESGWTDVEIAPNPTQPVFDITAAPPGGGAEVHWQVETGGAEYAQDVADAMAENPDVQVAVSSEIYGRISDSTPEAVDRLMDMGQIGNWWKKSRTGLVLLRPTWE